MRKRGSDFMGICHKRHGYSNGGKKMLTLPIKKKWLGDKKERKYGEII